MDEAAFIVENWNLLDDDLRELCKVIGISPEEKI